MLDLAEPGDTLLCRGKGLDLTRPFSQQHQLVREQQFLTLWFAHPFTGSKAVTNIRLWTGERSHVSPLPAAGDFKAGKALERWEAQSSELPACPSCLLGVLDPGTAGHVPDGIPHLPLVVKPPEQVQGLKQTSPQRNGRCQTALNGSRGTKITYTETVKGAQSFCLCSLHPSLVYLRT